MRPVLAAAGLLAVMLLASSGTRAEPARLLDFYRELQVAQVNGFSPYEISGGGEAAGEPATVSGSILYGDRARLALTLDEANFYLRIHDRGDGEGATPFVTEVAVWFDAEGFPLLGLSERGLKAGVPFAGRVRFYSRASGRWNLVTATVLPALDRDLCQAEPREVDESTAAWEGLGRVVILLPRRGTDLAAWCVGPGPMAGTGMILTWDRARSRFRKGRALAAPAPWPDAAAAP
ncbi:hypothetical protein K9U40_09795 [Xanthobacter autotrophicus]|uniref:hypothetical protein n=1 Tax=Xanthobacter TaxID=279 RepID=UPI0024ABF83B|nr:hypothetical protein [Xanthobacter autotrophicus]MDI4664615.1 hypothetical protein [Xanthobacter autotrophicus]